MVVETLNAERSSWPLFPSWIPEFRNYRQLTPLLSSSLISMTLLRPGYSLAPHPHGKKLRASRIFSLTVVGCWDKSACFRGEQGKYQ